MKRLIALGALLVGSALMVAPSSEAASACPPGTTEAENPYCVVEVTLVTHSSTATEGGTVKVVLSCTKGGSRCKGILLLVIKGAQSSAVASSGRTIGRAHYSMASGHKAKVRVHLTKRGRALLKRRGKIKVSAVSVVNGKRKTLGRLVIKAKKRKHVTHAHGHPGFTG